MHPNTPDRTHHKPGDDAPQAPGGGAVNRAATVATSAALGGAAAGALAGAAGGPVGAMIGAAVGAVAAGVAGVAGNSIAQSVDVEAEQAYWRDNYRHRGYVDAGASFDDYGPAYGYGLDGWMRHPGRSFEDAEPELARDWFESRRESGLNWDRARPAAQDAWARAHQLLGREGSGPR
jgi:hypothetical protein